MVEHKDAMGQLLVVGDFVAFKEDWYNGFDFGRVEKFTPKMVRINKRGIDTIKLPEHLLKIQGPFVEEFMASKGFV